MRKTVRFRGTIYGRFLEVEYSETRDGMMDLSNPIYIRRITAEEEKE